MAMIRRNARGATSGSSPTESASRGGPDLERGNGAAQEALRKSDLVVRATDPSFCGQVVAENEGEDNVRITSPQISFDATAALAEGVETDGIIQFGLSQTMESSHRELVYENDEGREVVRTVIEVPTARDARFQRGHRDRAVAPAPFYDTPSLLTDAPVQSQTIDQPSITAQKTAPGDAGVLARVEGEDRLRSAWTAEHEGEEAFYQRYEWAVPWEMDVENAMADEEVSVGETDQLPSVRDGDIATGQVAENYRIPSLERAMDMPVVALLDIAQRGDEQTMEFIRDALRRRAPHVEVDLEVEDTAEMFGSDELVLTANVGGSSGESRSQTLNDGDSGTFRIPLLDLINLGGLSDLSNMQLSVRDTGMIENSAHTKEWNKPFHDVSGRLLMDGDHDDAKYFITGARIR